MNAVPGFDRLLRAARTLRPSSALFTIDSVEDDRHEHTPMISTTTRVQYATGYIGLGLLDRAEAELAAIPAQDRELPDVLAAQAELAMAAKHWAEVVRFGRRLTEVEPSEVQGWVWWAYALREMQHIHEARSVLLQIEQTHGDDHAIVSYNLACYYCLLGEIDTAKRYFSVACKLDPSLKESIASDPDLVALRGKIEKP